MKTVSQLKYSVAGLLSGIDLTNIDDLNGCLERAASTMVQKADIPEASGMQNITLYADVIDYLCDTRIFGTAIKDIRPQGVDRNKNDFVLRMMADDFSRNQNYTSYPSGTLSTFEYQNGVPIIKIVSPTIKQKTIIDTMSDTTGWVASGSASMLAQDLGTYYKLPASLRVNLTGASTGILTKIIDSVDLTTFAGIGAGFLAIEIPTGNVGTDLTGIEIRIGSDSTNYYVSTQTSGFLGSWTVGNWLLVKFDSLSSVFGSPDITKIKYVQVRMTTGTTINNFRLGRLWISMPVNAEIPYKSSAIFLPTGTQTTKTTITTDNDTVILADPSYNIYIQECALSCLQNTGASASDATSIKINKILDGNGTTDIGLYARFRGDNPSETLRVTGSWYDNN